MIGYLLKKSYRIAGRIYHRKAPLDKTPLLENNQHLFIAGLHRSGTSILHRLLREHPATSGFYNTGAAEDEGQHLQSVFPKARRHGGAGLFAFDLDSHLTEESGIISPQNRDRILREWGAYYDLKKNVLLEKSPPNLVRSRFFQALLPNTSFVFIVRHPVAVTLATEKWTTSSILEMLFHWHVAYSIMLEDLKHIKNYVIIRYEDFVDSPQSCLDQVCDLVDIARFSPEESIIDHNPKYFQIWEQKASVDREIIEHALAFTDGPMERFGYSFSEPYFKSAPVGMK